jgi:hypothetical protein
MGLSECTAAIVREMVIEKYSPSTELLQPANVPGIIREN